MSGAPTRRGLLTGSAAAALGLAAGVAPALAMVAPVEGKSLASADDALIDLAGRISTLATRRRAATGRVERLEMQVEAVHPRPPLPVTNDVFHAYRAEIRPTEERIGLVHLRKMRRRSAERLDRWASDLAAMEPSTPAGLAAKAGAVLAIDDLCGESAGAEALILSLLRDAVRLGGGAHA